MSPEQAKGKETDRTTDIWAFSCVLYEMLTGRLAFEGDSVAEVLGAILKTEPDWNRLPAAPDGIRRLLRRCLQKTQQRRLHDVADARIEIDDTYTELKAPRRMVALPVVVVPTVNATGPPVLVTVTFCDAGGAPVIV